MGDDEARPGRQVVARRSTRQFSVLAGRQYRSRRLPATSTSARISGRSGWKSQPGQGAGLRRRTASRPFRHERRAGAHLHPPRRRIESSYARWIVARMSSPALGPEGLFAATKDRDRGRWLLDRCWKTLWGVQATGRTIEIIERDDRVDATSFAWDLFLVRGSPRRQAPTSAVAMGLVAPFRVPRAAFDSVGNWRIAMGAYFDFQA